MNRLVLPTVPLLPTLPRELLRISVPPKFLLNFAKDVGSSKIILRKLLRRSVPPNVLPNFAEELCSSDVRQGE